MKGGLPIVGLVCLLASSSALAGTVYRCESGDGGISYVSRRLANSHCSVVSQYRSSRSRSALAPPAAAVGGLLPANPVDGSPASRSSPPASTGTIATANTMAAPALPAPSAPAPARSGRLVQGQVYSYIQDGVRHYTSKRPSGLAGGTALRTIKYSFMETCYACAARPGVDFGRVRLNTQAYRDEIAAAAAQFGVEEAIVRAIIHAESAYNPNALSRVGAQGLMQLMPATARRFGVMNPFDAAQNIRGGVQYLAWLLRRFNGDLTLAAAGYNAGEGAVDKYKGVPPYSETQRYVARVSQLAERYRGGAAPR